MCVACNYKKGLVQRTLVPGNEVRYQLPALNFKVDRMSKKSFQLLGGDIIQLSLLRVCLVCSLKCFFEIIAGRGWSNF